MTEPPTASSVKRQRADDTHAVTNGPDAADGDDPVIGIDCGGQVFYTHKSTLTAGSAYFAARFGGAFSAGESYEDERGRKVYFVDADAKTFEHIVTYLRRGIASWPDWVDDPKFHQRLVAEAEYFGLDAVIVEKLKCVASIKYDPENRDGRGIFYWLGSSYGRKKYENPYDLGEVSFSGFNREAHHDIDIELHKCKFIQHRPKCDALSDDVYGLNCDCRILWCDGALNGDKLVIKLTSVAVKPTYYSLRFGSCFGMSDWNFEASADGHDWEV